MKPIWISLFLLSFGLSNGLWAQMEDLPPQKREQFEAFVAAFMTRRLSLSAEEAKQFWPVYDAYKDELEAVRKDIRRKERLARADFQSLSESELNDLADGYLEAQSKTYEIKAKYHEEFKKILPIRKVVLLYRAEQDLNRELLKKMQQMRQQRKNMNGNR